MGRTKPQQLLLKQRQNGELVLGNGHGDQAQIEAAGQQAGDDFLGRGHGHQNLSLRKPAAQQAQRLAEAVDQRRGAGGEVERAIVGGFILAELLFHPADLVQNRARMFRQAEGVRGGGDLAARADEEFHPQIGAQGPQLLAHRSGAQPHHFRRPGDAGGIHHRQEDAQLSQFHTI